MIEVLQSFNYGIVDRDNRISGEEFEELINSTTGFHDDHLLLVHITADLQAPAGGLMLWRCM